MLFASPTMTWVILPSRLTSRPICLPIADDIPVMNLPSSCVIIESEGILLRWMRSRELNSLPLSPDILPSTEGIVLDLELLEFAEENFGVFVEGADGNVEFRGRRGKVVHGFLDHPDCMKDVVALLLLA